MLINYLVLAVILHHQVADPYNFLEMLFISPEKLVQFEGIFGTVKFFITFFKDFFLMWTICKVFTEFVTRLILFYTLVFCCDICGILAS